MPTKIYVVNDKGHDNENSDEEKFHNAKTYVREHLSDKVDDIFSFAGRLEVVPSVKHFRPRLLPLRLRDLSCDKFLIYALFLSERVCKGKE